MLQNGTHPQPSGVAALAKKPTPTFTPTRPGAAPYQIPSQLGQTRPTGHMAGAAPSQGQPQGQGQHSALNGSNGGAGPVRPGGGFGSNGNGTTGPGGPHGLPRMGIFPTNSNNNSNLNSGNGSSMQNRPMPGSGAPGSSHMQTQNRPVPGSVAPGGPSGFNGGLNRPGMPIRTNGSGPTSGSGIGGPGASQGQAQKQNGAGAGAGAGSGGPLSGGNNGVSSFARPAVGQIPPHRPGQPPHSQGGQQQQQQQGRPGNLQMSGFPPLRASQPAQSNINQQNRPAQQLGSNSNSNIQIPKSATVPNEPPVQRGRDAVLFAAVETMDL